MTRKRRPPKTPVSTPVPPLAPPTAPGDPWPQLRKFTAARIGLPRSGASLAGAAQGALGGALSGATHGLSEGISLDKLIV